MRPAFFLLAFLPLLSFLSTPASASHDETEHACPETREFIEPYLNTLPEDGLLYDRQRAALKMTIDEILSFMGGVERAYAIAEATRQDAEEKIAAGARGAERRYHQDTILRADALIEILNCMTTTDDAGARDVSPARHAALWLHRNRKK